MSIGRFEWERAVRALELRPPMIYCVALTIGDHPERPCRSLTAPQRRVYR